MRRLRILALCGLLAVAAGCGVDRDGAASLLVSNLSSYRARCLVSDGTDVYPFWVESNVESSVLLDMGEYQVKIELYQGSQVLTARLIPVSLIQVGRVHQIVVKDEWIK